MYEMGKAELDALKSVIKSGQTFRYRGGEGGWCDRFETALKKKIGVRYAVTTNSGTSALICALAGIGVGPGDEVIVPAYTFMASAIAVTAVGGIPIIVDIDESLTIAPSAVERAVTRYTKAVIPVHMNGRVCDMDALRRLAGKHGMKIVEDACQAVGGSYRGRRLTSIGDVGAFSFNHFKIISCGEGGAVLTDDMKIYDRALILHDGGAVFRAYADKLKTPFFAGMNFRVSEFQGAILHEQLRRLDRILANLRARQAAMTEVFASSPNLRISPNNDPAGDCGCCVSLTFGSGDEAKAFAERVNSLKAGCGAGRPIDSGRHVYVNWEPILKKQGSHNGKLNPFRWARRKIEYGPDMCARTLDILARTVMIGVPYGATPAECRRMARRIIG